MAGFDPPSKAGPVDQDDRAYSRAPDLEDLLALCRALTDGWGRKATEGSRRSDGAEPTC